MSSPAETRIFQWRRFTVDLLTACAALATATTLWATADILDVLLLCGVLLALGILIEPDVSRAGLPARDAARPLLRWT